MTDERYRENEDEAFAEQAGKLLKDASEHLDAATLSRLNQARQSALAELERGQRKAGVRWLPAGALAASALIATALWLGREPDVIDNSAAAEQFEDLDILLSDEDFELYDELEFFSWLDAELDSELETTDEIQGQG